MVLNDSWSKARMSSVTNPLQQFLERILSDSLAEHDGKNSIGGRNITNVQFVDGIDAVA